MNGIHDMGGMQGLGEIGYQASEPMFHAPWEGRGFALIRDRRGTAMLGDVPAGLLSIPQQRLLVNAPCEITPATLAELFTAAERYW